MLGHRIRADRPSRSDPVMDMAVVCGRHVGGLEPVHFKSVDLQKRALDFRVARRQQEDFAARMNQALDRYQAQMRAGQSKAATVSRNL